MVDGRYKRKCGPSISGYATLMSPNEDETVPTAGFADRMEEEETPQ